MQLTMEKNHLDWINACKGVLILLVVLGHTLGQVISYDGIESHQVLAEINRWIYLFHVPAFFVVAGLVWKASNASFMEMLKKRGRRLLVPYFVFGFVSVVLYLLVVEKSFSSFPKYVLSLVYASGWGGAFKANAPLWFLPCMFTACVIYWVIDRLFPWARFKWVQTAFAPMSYFLYRWLLGKWGPEALPFGTVIAFRLLPCLILGRLIGAETMASLKERLSSKLLFGGGLVLSCIATHGADVLQEAGLIGNWIWGFLWWVLSLLASIAGLMVFSTMKAKWLYLFGVHSLGIMLVHKFFVVAIGMKMCSDLWPFVFAAASAGSLAVSVVISRICPVLLGSRCVRDTFQIKEN